ncbi:RNI-like protein [Trametes coccinea BRFM310]|uniref:RNI-like protein n=1 Tax=Trametes coccinea (strain BRFM310) TaxID=1353009 RepID=A0A1Y2ITV8_TRAC3|nr:RNI-like protein [Trametes coccinea BRFM310]
MSYVDALPSDEESCYYAEHLEFRPDDPSYDSHDPSSDNDRPPPITDDELASVLPRCPNLTSALLSGIPDLSDRTLILLATRAPHLARLSLASCRGITDLGLSALAAHATALTALTLSHVRGATDRSLARLVRGLPQLRALEMDGLPLVTAHAVRDVWLFARGLRRWSMSGCMHVADEGFPWVPDEPQGGVGAAGPPTPARPKTKTWLESLPPLVLPATHKLTELGSLDLSHCARITDAAVRGVVAHAPRIRELNLAGCIELTDRALRALCALGGHLVLVDIAGLWRVTDEGVFALASACRRLRVVDVSFIPTLSDLVVLELASLPRLQHLAAAGLPRLTDHALCFLAEHTPSLETLHLSYCTQLTLDGVRAVLRRLTKLAHLNLTGVPALRRRGVRRFSEPPSEGYEEGKQGVYREFRGGKVQALGAFLEKEEWRRREAERANVPFRPRGDDSRALY